MRRRIFVLGLAVVLGAVAASPIQGGYACVVPDHRPILATLDAVDLTVRVSEMPPGSRGSHFVTATIEQLTTGIFDAREIRDDPDALSELALRIWTDWDERGDGDNGAPVAEPIAVLVSLELKQTVHLAPELGGAQAVAVTWSCRFFEAASLKELDYTAIRMAEQMLEELSSGVVEARWHDPDA